MLCVKPLQSKKRTLKLTFFSTWDFFLSFVHICVASITSKQVFAPWAVPWGYGTMAHVIANRHSSHPGRFPLLAASFPRWHPNHINLGASHLHPGHIFLGKSEQPLREAIARERDTQAEAVTSRFAHWNYKVFHLEFSRFQHDDDVKVGGYVRPDSLRHSGGNILKCWMSSVCCRSPSRDRFGAAAAERERRKTRQRPHSSSRSTWTS